MGLALFITKVRFDDLHALSLLSSRLKGPSQLDLEFAIHAANYLIYTRDLPLIFYPSNEVEEGQIQTDELEFEGATDAAFRSHQSSQAQQGIGFKLLTGNIMGMESKSGMVSASSKRSQGAIDGTVSDSELASGVEGGKEASWMCLLMEDLGITGPPILLLTDNTSLLDNVRTFKTSRKQRHVLGNIHFLRKETEEGRSVWGAIPGYGMYVDTLTKSLPTSKKAVY